jgi:hypothetical protein
MKYYLISVLIVCIALFIKCGQGANDKVQNMGMGFIYRAEGSIRYIYNEDSGRLNNSIVPDVITHKYNKKHIIAIQKPSLDHCIYNLAPELYLRYLKIIIPDDSLKKYPPNFSELKKLWLRDTLLCQAFKKYELSAENSIEDQYKCNKIADSIIKNSPYYLKIFKNEYNYWIVEKSSHKLYGPYSKQEYLKKRKDLGVKENLVFSDKYNNL